MSITAEDLAIAERIAAGFEARGAARIEADILQPAETLLDLYGEDIRARAYTTGDPLRGEQMLRPDFTVPVVQMHMAASAMPARYTYAGPVFRRQESDAARASEYLQVGYEVFDTNRAQADAEVLSAVLAALDGVQVTVQMGDLGLLTAAVDALPLTAHPRSMLMRHIWRPKRFDALLKRYSEGGESVKNKVNSSSHASSAEVIGKRRPEEVSARLERLEAGQSEPRLPSETLDMLDALQDIKGSLQDALTQLQKLAQNMAALEPGVRAFEVRIAAFEAAGINLSQVEFDANHGRQSMEYYDGMVFSVVRENQPGSAPLALGGRYDALTRALGKGRDFPAVGSVIRPAELRAAEGGHD